ncbi:hypothetical protein QIG59_28020, partial [Klebsiella pneumoniae]|nr:hypothetical protein [Klebsiella pneumoniae]
YPSVAPPIRRLHAALAAGRNVRSIICVSCATETQFSHCRHKVKAIQTALDVAEFDSSAVKPVLRDEFGLAPQT